jgi:hypothetical protein
VAAAVLDPHKRERLLCSARGERRAPHSTAGGPARCAKIKRRAADAPKQGPTWCRLEPALV